MNASLLIGSQPVAKSIHNLRGYCLTHLICEIYTIGSASSYKLCFCNNPLFGTYTCRSLL